MTAGKKHVARWIVRKDLEPYGLGNAEIRHAGRKGSDHGIAALLSNPALQDPQPRGTHDRTEPDQAGDPALDTVLYPDLGGLRLDYVLPAAGMTVTRSGVQPNDWKWNG